jgi:Zn-dependent peptidase ImmA (M78 family)
LHTYLFAAAASPGLFGDIKKSNLIQCKRETTLTTSQTDWMEWQAGYACGAILMPATHIRQLADDYRRKAELHGPVPPQSQHGRTMIESVMTRFQVSRDAARVRLSALGVLGLASATPRFSSIFKGLSG